MVCARRPTLVDASIGLAVQTMACGSGHTLLLLTDGTVVAFGRNDLGQVGAESRREEALTDFSIRVPHRSHHWMPQRLSITGIVQIFSESYTCFAIGRDGEIYYWGQHMVPVPTPEKSCA
jgi:alpha-tubulin suppressor-like RCC1 family protein